MSLDYYASMFQSLHNSEVDQSIVARQDMALHVHWDEAAQRWQNKVRMLPALFHFNGGSKQFVDVIWEKAVKGYKQIGDQQYGQYVQQFDTVKGLDTPFPVMEVGRADVDVLAQMKGWTKQQPLPRPH